MNPALSSSITGFVMPVGNGAVGKTTVSRVLDLLSKGETITEDILQRIRKTNNLEFEYITTHQTFDKTQYTITLQFLVPSGQKEVEGDPTGRSFEKIIDIYRSSIRRLDVILFTYDLANLESFHDLVYWVDSVESLMNDATHFILLGTHLDQKKEIVITQDEIKEGLEYLRKEIRVIRPTWMGRSTHLEVSCITGENIDILLRYLAACIYSVSH